MDKQFPYNCLAIFSRPLNLNGQIIYGILFNKQREIDKYERRYLEEGGTKYLNGIEDYLKYLYSCDDYYNSENKIKTGIWSNQWGDSIISDWVLTNTSKNSKKVEYTLIEKDVPIQFNENETDDDWVISPELIERVKK